MHESSFMKARIFVDQYGPDISAVGPARVLEIGSKSYHGQDTYRALFPADRFSYVGLDVEDGENVDVVPKNAFVWNELAECSFDICVSGQTFEHNPYFWVTFAEIARVLVPGGLALIVAPGGGAVHRYPVDCWRFYPDSWAALCAVTGLELVESYFETDETAAAVPGGKWRDSAAIVRKPVLVGEALQAFHDHLGGLVRVFQGEGMPVRQAPSTPGKWVKAYQAEVRERFPLSPRKALKRWLIGKSGRIADAV